MSGLPSVFFSFVERMVSRRVSKEKRDREVSMVTETGVDSTLRESYPGIEACLSFC